MKALRHFLWIPLLTGIALVVSCEKDLYGPAGNTVHSNIKG